MDGRENRVVKTMLWSTLLSFRWLGLLGPSRGHFHDRRRLSCKEEYLDVKLDWNAPYAADDEGSLALRYFWCGGRNSEPANPEPPRALFVYFGNEAPVRIDLDRRALAPPHRRTVAPSHRRALLRLSHPRFALASLARRWSCTSRTRA